MRREKGRKKRGWKERLTAPHIIPEDKGCSELFLYEHFHLCGSQYILSSGKLCRYYFHRTTSQLEGRPQAKGSDINGHESYTNKSGRCVVVLCVRVPLIIRCRFECMRVFVHLGSGSNKQLCQRTESIKRFSTCYRLHHVLHRTTVFVFTLSALQCRSNTERPSKIFGEARQSHFRNSVITSDSRECGMS